MLPLTLPWLKAALEPPQRRPRALAYVRVVDRPDLGDPEPLPVWLVYAALEGRSCARFATVVRGVEDMALVFDVDPFEAFAAALCHPQSPFGLELRTRRGRTLLHRGQVTETGVQR